VRIHSEVGKGTTIRLYLPRALTGTADLPALATPSTPQGDGETILVVEDDATVRLLITSVLKELGYRYMEVPDAATALAILQRIVDLLITNVGLPVTNGRQLAEITQHSHPNLKVLFVTGYAGPQPCGVVFWRQAGHVDQAFRARHAWLENSAMIGRHAVG
jgi:CheY-like chemotaxis protein